MSLLTHTNAKLTELGLSSSVNGSQIEIQRESPNRPLVFTCSQEWKDNFLNYQRARTFSFDVERRILRHNNSIEILVYRLSQNAFGEPLNVSLSDSSGNTVEISQCSPAFAFAFFDSDEYSKFFDIRVKKRFLESSLATRKIESLLWRPYTATYRHRGRRAPVNLKDIAEKAIRASLFKIAVEQNDCIAIWKPRTRTINIDFAHTDTDSEVPRANYNEDAVSFYKVAKASPFPSQSFLAYYHILEYYFLQVSETKLRNRLATIVNETSSPRSNHSINKMIALIRGQDARNDETEMLRNVLDRYVQESDLIEFITEIEQKAGAKIYSRRRRIFGEDLQVSLQADHALANTSKILKHIRNALVHSSDRYKREDCHIPLSESEELIEEFIPLIRFLAEKVIFGAAES